MPTSGATGDVSRQDSGPGLDPVCPDAGQSVRDADREFLVSLSVYNIDSIGGATPKFVGGQNPSSPLTSPLPFIRLSFTYFPLGPLNTARRSG